MTSREGSVGAGWFGLDRKWWTLAVVAAGTFMSALDGSIVVTALPVIRSATGAPVSDVEWVLLIYQLVVSSSLLVFGRLADIYGQRGIYIAGLVIFVAGSAMCGFAPGVGTLIAFRGVQAIGAAMVFALAPALLTDAFPGRERGRALGMQATATYLGLAIGPALGGFVTYRFGWPWIFFINVPIGAVVVSVAHSAIRPAAARSAQPFDPSGAASLAVGLTGLLLALSKGNDLGWGSPLVATSMAVAVAAFTLFFLVERRVGHPVLDLKLFSNRVFAASTAAALLNYMASTSVSFLMPFYLIDANHYSPADAGLILVSTPVAMALVTGYAGWLSDKIGYRVPTTVGMALTVSGMLLLRTLKVGSRPSEIVPHLALIGLGIGLFTSPNNSAIMGSAPANRRGVAAALLAAARNVGFAIGTAVAGLVYIMRQHSLQSVAPTSQAVLTGVQDATSLVALVAIVGVVASAVRRPGLGACN